MGTLKYGIRTNRIKTVDLFTLAFLHCGLSAFMLASLLLFNEGVNQQNERSRRTALHAERISGARHHFAREAMGGAHERQTWLL